MVRLGGVPCSAATYRARSITSWYACPLLVRLSCLVDTPFSVSDTAGIGGGFTSSGGVLAGVVRGVVLVVELASGVVRGQVAGWG